MKVFPFSRFEVKGSSMEPVLKQGDRVLTFNFSAPKKGDLVVARKNSMEIIKRVKKVSVNSFFVIGDNLGHSTDSRHFGLIKRNEIVGKVLMKY